MTLLPHFAPQWPPGWLLTALGKPQGEQHGSLTATPPQKAATVSLLLPLRLVNHTPPVYCTRPLQAIQTASQHSGLLQHQISLTVGHVQGEWSFSTQIHHYSWYSITGRLFYPILLLFLLKTLLRIFVSQKKNWWDSSISKEVMAHYHVSCLHGQRTSQRNKNSWFFSTLAFEAMVTSQKQGLLLKCNLVLLENSSKVHFAGLNTENPSVCQLA